MRFDTFVLPKLTFFYRSLCLAFVIFSNKGVATKEFHESTAVTVDIHMYLTSMILRDLPSTVANNQKKRPVFF
jgi:hypothetical protein